MGILGNLGVLLMTQIRLKAHVRLSLVAALAAMATLSGCATITRGSQENFTVTTDPAGAAIKTSNGFSCEATPCTFRMPRKTDFTVTATKAGYKPAKATVSSTFVKAGGQAMAGNILFGGVIGGIIDTGNGSLNDLLPNPLTIKMEKDDGTGAAAADSNAAAPATK